MLTIFRHMSIQISPSNITHVFKVAQFANHASQSLGFPIKYSACHLKAAKFMNSTGTTTHRNYLNTKIKRLEDIALVYLFLLC